MKQAGFNPKARWDRHIPETGRRSDPQELNEHIVALAWFRNGKIQPRLFIWKNKKYKIKRINYAWQERRGQETINCFSIDTGSDLYQISFNNISYSWHLDRL
jgi:hypothetical protein